MAMVWPRLKPSAAGKDTNFFAHSDAVDGPKACGGVTSRWRAWFELCGSHRPAASRALVGGEGPRLDDWAAETDL